MSMSLLDFNCDFLSTLFTFSLEDFDKNAFLKAVEVGSDEELIDEDGDFVYRMTFRSRVEPPTEHGHLSVVLSVKKGTGRASFNFHQIGEHGDDGSNGPSLEDATKWFSQFVKKHNSPIRVTAAYEFDKEYSTTIPLPFPLVTSNKMLSGLKVNGLSLQFPPENRVEDAILQHRGNDTYLFLVTRSETNLPEFDLDRELQDLNEVVHAFIRQEKSDAAEQSISDRTGGTGRA